ncbi:N-acetylmuramoyl-L-alanine amidase [Streptomyces sp. MUM 203J]|uniref:N-acetylmuramoyl-L-alanine amidase n=1 Tax=Streptomyces sp. MUM 203J TaxID=2791990 RepID=UPI001F04C0A2|nr:N-acetylmuramoyl-L-alanine amidase [Streptomyces sp. MUM 203J]MCH0539037.1 N-acetylmuramoyl-L-alanine amidase [Streptomyces sp. MUM 203J]
MAAAVTVPLAGAVLAGWLVWTPSDGTEAPSAAASSGAVPSASSVSPLPLSPSASPEKAPPLTGKVVVIDPGHNPGNFQHSREINKTVDIGTNRKECDTTGTAARDGYTEAAFTLDVSHRLRDLLEERGATVVLTHDADRPFGPCIDERARIGNEAGGGRGADAVVSVHADGSAAGHRGFHVILPAQVKAGSADTAPIVGPSRTLGERIAAEFARVTGSRPANYLGGGTGLDVRKDLGGLNLSTVPKVFVECGNMRDPDDAASLEDPGWRGKAARGIADGITTYLRG